MTIQRQLEICATRDELVRSVADRFVATAVARLSEQSLFHVVLTGGTVGIAILAAVRDAPDLDRVDWARVHLWWGDERWVPSDHADRNERQAREALIDHVTIPAVNIHPFAADDGSLGLDQAADTYAAELLAFGDDGADVPSFDIVFLGMGPDGHIASLFPNRGEIAATASSVVAVRDSPKPPPERLSLSLASINNAQEIWVALAGADKASPLGLALAGANVNLVPAAGAHGRRTTLFFADEAAAAEVPAELKLHDD